MSDRHDVSGDGRQKRHDDAEIARIAGKQFGVVSLAQLTALGVSYEQVRRRVERGLLHRLHRGVFVVGHTSVVPHARLLAALLACGPEAFLSHRTAAGVWGLREIATKRIEVTLPCTGTRVRPGLKMHCIVGPPDPADVALRNGLRVSSVPRMMLELAALERQSELERLITEAVRKRILDPRAVEQALARTGKRAGVGKLKAALRGYRPGPDRKSDLERAFDRLIAGTDIPQPLRNIVIDGWEIDCYWPEHALAVELDGRPYHIAVRDMEKDRVKDAKLLRKGIRVVRVTDLRMELDPAGTLGDVRALLKL